MADLDRTELGQFSESPEDRAVRRKVQELDRIALGEAVAHLGDAAVNARAQKCAGLEVPERPAYALLGAK